MLYFKKSIMSRWSLGLDKKDLLITTLVVLLGFAIWVDQSYQPEKIDEIRAIVGEAASTTNFAEFNTDGCTLWVDDFLDHSFTRICVEHDLAYWRGGSLEEKEKSDLMLRDKINGILPYMGDVMYQGVRLFGHPILPTPWRWGYGVETEAQQ